MSANHLEKQIEQIADEATSNKLSVIVQMQASDDLEEYLRVTSEAIDMRRAVTSARSLIPLSKSQLRVGASGMITPATKRRLERSDDLSALLFLVSQAIKPLAEEALKSVGL